MKKEISSETAHMIEVLRQAIHAAQMSTRDVERELQWGPGYLSRIFAGIQELHFDHVVAIGRALGAKPREFWRILYPAPQSPPSATATRLAEILARLQPPPTWTPEVESRFEARLEQALWRALGRRLNTGGG